jgi:HrpA-like RNA helicase
MRLFGRRPGFPSRRVFEEAAPRRTLGALADEVLELLSDGELRDLADVASSVGISEAQAEGVVDLLAKLGALHKKVRITEVGKSLLRLPLD